MHDGLAAYMDVLRKKRVGVFADLQQERSFSKVLLAEVAISKGQSHSPDVLQQIWKLSPAMFVHGMRVQRPEQHTPGLGTPYVVVSWRGPEHEDFSVDRRYLEWWEGLKSESFWLYQCVEEIRIEVQYAPAGFRIPEISLLVADPGKNASEMVAPPRRDEACS
jgi:hypothetical protein